MKISMRSIIGIALILAVAISIYAGSVNDTGLKSQFIAQQSQRFVAAAMQAYRQYIDESVSGTTIIYKSYKAGTGNVYISKETIIEHTGNTTEIFTERALDAWTDRASATYEPINAP
jgi:hypothetical protein